MFKATTNFHRFNSLQRNDVQHYFRPLNNRDKAAYEIDAHKML